MHQGFQEKQAASVFLASLMAVSYTHLDVYKRQVLCIYGAVRGVGGIDSWGTDVEEDYRISAETDKDYSCLL